MLKTDIADSSPGNREVNLLSAARTGSNGSLGDLLLIYRDYLLAIADDELGTDLKVKASASDLVQESFLEAKRDFDQFTGATPVDFQRWLRKLLLNNVANVVRGFRGTEKRNVLRETSISQFDQNKGDGGLTATDPSASSIAMRNELLVAVQAVIQTLPQHYQDVIQWRNYERVPFVVIGQRLGRSAEASQQLWVRALDALQQELDWSDDSKSLRSGSELQRPVDPV